MHASGDMHRAIHDLWPQFHKEHDRHSLENLTKKDPVCQFLRKLDGKPILDPYRAFKSFFDVKPREDVSHTTTCTYTCLERERETPASLHIGGMIAF